MRVALAVLAVSGCSFSPGAFRGGSNTPDDGDVEDVMTDVSIDAPMNATCYGKGLTLVCHPVGSPPTKTYAPTGPINTSTDGNCDQIITQQGGPELCVVVAKFVSIGVNVRYTGSRAIVLLGTDQVAIGGGIDVSEGAGSNIGACAGATAGDANTASSSGAGAGGGGGGGFGTDGGDGGDGEDAAVGGNGGNAVTPTNVRGGCPGFKGGDSSGGGGGGGGTGGGAMYLISGVQIAIGGTLNASGGGGRGTAASKAGGGGGGSGGLIVLDAPDVVVNGFAYANGGGGGEGGGGGFGGEDGEDPTFWNFIPDGGGGVGGNSAGGNGGNGAYTNVGATPGSDVGNGGGGGGGGAGRILVFATTTMLGTTISPAPVVTTIP